MEQRPAMLRLSEIDKSYGATRALKSVSLEAAPGTVLGLVGENGAGKSTLMKIVGGAIAPDHGTLSLDGRAVAPRSTHEALTLGIASVFQELTLVRELTVEQNLLLTRSPVTPWGSIDRRRTHAMASEILARHELDIAPRTRVGDLPLGRQQMLEIVRAVERQPRILLLDEATSALGGAEVEWLAALVERLRHDGRIVLFISHRWDEVVHFSNRVAVLRNGELMAVANTGDLSEGEAVRLMSGRETLSESFPRKRQPTGGIALAATALISPVLDGIDIELGHGEILGLGGLVGQGQGHLLEAFFGAHALTSGAILVGGNSLDRPTPRRAIKAGLAYVPQERKTEGLLMSKSVGQNLTLAILGRLPALFGVIAPRQEAELVDDAIARAAIRSRGGGETIRHLSGGNQQKVLLERWLLRKPRILLLNDVTRGVDVGTKRHIYDVIAAIAATGVGIIWYSTDARELVGVAHRVLVMLHGRISAELTGADVTVDRIVHAAVVGTNPAAANA
jgi:ribose transport system ATP-binding protein